MNITDRLIICGQQELPALLNRGNVGAVICLSSRRERQEKEWHEPLSLIRQMNIPFLTPRIFHPEDIHSWLDAAPDAMTAPYITPEISENVTAAEKLFHDTGNKKIIICCRHGFDRSAAFAALLIEKLLRTKNHVRMKQALRMVYQLRPQAKLEIFPNTFKNYYGSHYPYVESLMNKFRGAASQRARILTESWVEAEREEAIRSYNRQGQKFGMKPIG